MRTIEECAEFIENVTGANLSDNDLSDTVREYANILDGISFDRLHEICQAEREGRCVYCLIGKHFNSDGEPLYVHGNEIVAQAYNEPDNVAKINYCPMCGKKLEDKNDGY